MKIRRLIAILLIITGIFSLSGCGDKDEVLTIKPEIYEYTPAMSSVPGIALVAEATRDLKNQNFKFHWIAEQGTFLKWHNNEKIIVLGKDIKTNEHKVFWTVSQDGKIKESSFNIYLIVEENNSSEAIAKTSIQIEQKKEGYFSIKN